MSYGELKIEVRCDHPECSAATYMDVDVDVHDGWGGDHDYSYSSASYEAEPSGPQPTGWVYREHDRIHFGVRYTAKLHFCPEHQSAAHLKAALLPGLPAPR